MTHMMDMMRIFHMVRNMMISQRPRPGRGTGRRRRRLRPARRSADRRRS